MTTHKRLLESFNKEGQQVTEDIPGEEVKIVKIEGFSNFEFLIMSTGVIYSRPIYFVENKNSKWRLLHDERLLKHLYGDKSNLEHHFKSSCDALTVSHLELHSVLSRNPKNSLLIKQAISNYRKHLSYLYSKVNAHSFLSKPELAH